MKPDTRLLLINLYQGIADSLRAGTITLTEDQAQTLLRSFAPPADPRPRLRICNISQACDYLNISQPTFRKLVRQGTLPRGRKIAGFREHIWYKDDIEDYARKHNK